MEEFIENFSEFRYFLNSLATEHMISKMVGEQGKQVLNIIKDKFDKLGLNNSF